MTPFTLKVQQQNCKSQHRNEDLQFAYFQIHNTIRICRFIAHF